jgi:hypothetical protein
MKALLLHDIVPDAAVARQLAEAGYEVVRCAPTGTKAFPCVGMSGTCPLDGSVDVAVVVHDRPTTEVATGEVGTICARRDDIPIVIAGNGTHSPLQEVATAVAPSVDDVVGACERAVAAREARLGRIAGGIVRVAGGQVRATLPSWASTADVVRAHQQLTEAVPTARSIDIAVSPPA